MFANPQENLEKFGLSAGSIVADLGAGTGHYALLAAKMVSGNISDGGVGHETEGKVYAVDVQKDLIDKLKNEAAHQHITNVEIIWGNIEKLGGTKLRDHICDVVIVSNVFFQVEDRDGFIKEVSRILKPSGRIFFIEWSDSFGGIGPTVGAVVKPADAKSIFEKHGFVVERDVSVGSHHYGLVIRKKI